MSKVSYKKCPRCDLNYIDARKEMCDVCKQELNMPPDLLDEDEEIEKELCPICKIRFIGLDDDMCDICVAEKAAKDMTEEDDSWRNFIDDEQLPDDEDEDIEIPLEELQDEEFNEIYDDEDDIDSVDSIDDFEDEDYDGDIGDFEDDDYEDDEDDDE